MDSLRFTRGSSTKLPRRFEALDTLCGWLLSIEGLGNYMSALKKKGHEVLPTAPRRPHSVRPRTMSKRDLERMDKREKAQGHERLEVIPYQRPQLRQDCRDKARPCLYVSCVHHLYLDVTDKGSIVFNYPELEPWELKETCSLDVAEKEDGLTLEEIGEFLNLTRERVRQVERSALHKLKAGGKVEQ